MKHRLLTTLALAVLACAVVAATALGGGKGRLYSYRGDVVSTTSTSLQISVTGGDHRALKALIGQSENETFTLGDKSKILVWTNGVPHTASVSDLKQGDDVTINLRAKAGASLADLLATPAATVADRGTRSRSSSTSARSRAARPAAASRCTSRAVTGAGCGPCSASRSTRRSPTTTAPSSYSGRAACRP